MEYGYMIWSPFDEQWVVRVDQDTHVMQFSMPFDLRIHGHFYEVNLWKDSVWHVFLGGVRFNLSCSEVYRIRLDESTLFFPDIPDENLPF
ncbi:hypothetical protein [Natribacillus halophilus]|uniref:DUF5348 domain-containing protein n=1 Tax=Natribacillus halophilus TaxID=549003 RepID=A0A1G8PAM9_9BACI|nr:hypothetical protein [Natribacillus halophilus]SDI89368.1 hypothetical protein SAMN04488123_10832 [Natribacillus halophilus]